MSYSPQTLEMVARRAYAAAYSECGDEAMWLFENVPVMQEIFQRIARWHLDEMEGLEKYKQDREDHSIDVICNLESCPHCAKATTPTDPNEDEL